MDKCLNAHLNTLHVVNYCATGCKRFKLANEPLIPMIFGQVGQTNERIEVDKFKVLLDSGANGSLVTHQLVRNLGTSTKNPTVWTTAAGELKTSLRCKTLLQLTEFSKKSYRT